MKYILLVLICFNCYAMEELRTETDDKQSAEITPEIDIDKIDYRNIENIDWSQFTEEQKEIILLRHFGCLNYCEF